MVEAPNKPNRPRRVADMIVVGAGPAGCAAAITAVRAGAKVVMIDKARFPRDKCCGDGL
ncbi:MAG: FAD-dependent oxidoreductase, partial [Acidimicrobiales bacterium]